HVLHLAGAPVEAADPAPVHDGGVQRIGCDVAVLLGADRMPLPERDLTVVAPAHDPDRAALLLPAVYPIRKTTVGCHVVELRRRLIVPRAPGLAAVDRHHRALVTREQDDRGVVRIDAQAMVVVPAGGAAERGERVPAVQRLPRHHVGDVHDVGVGGVDLDLVEVAVPAPQTLVRVREAPVLTAVIRAIQTTPLGRADHGVHASGSARRRGEPDTAETLCGTGEPGPDPAPGGAA